MSTINAASLAARLDSWKASPGTGEPELVDKKTVDTMAAKVNSANGVTGTAASAASAIKGLKERDAVQVSGDVLKLTSEALKKTPVANNLAAGGNLLTSVEKAAEGDVFYAASAASTALEKFSPALSNSAAGAVANAIVLGASSEKIDAQQQTIVKSAQVLARAKAAPGQKTKAALDLGTAASGLANFYRTAINAGVKLGQYGLRLGARVGAIAPAAMAVEAKGAAFMATRLGRGLGLLNKWVPLLNVAGVALSAKTAVDVFRDDRSSKTSKVLSLASVGTAAGALVAGITMGALPFFGIVAGSVVADLALAKARKADAEGADTDAMSREWARHPVQSLGQLFGWGRREVPVMAKQTAEDMVGRVKRLGLPAKPTPVAPDQPLVHG